ncbi:carboxymuconolactone decarboxylase family protein [Herbiconiux sp. L3-i23]|uniref:carboxymuconolactone decarboxylase family protein n=1 Tax=Herbiconiux sp. L3-i23 TaxID=2905871 RepID=UPI002052D32A|nr:carboxymuconolactone decarboxylase family protein [Herbiconiux sp. L3-i23]BDI23521.1 alkyl hydroperoxide reductase AhpD [Herbiconiux sp. L3-i23]
MAIIETVPEGEATGRVAEFYGEDVRDQGFVAAHTRVLSLNPSAHAAFDELIAAIREQMDPRRYELVTLAAALGTGSVHCRLAHGRKALPLFDHRQLVRIARDYHDAGLSDAEVAMMEYAERAGRESAAMTEDDSARLRDAGFTDREIVDITLAAAARNYYSRAIQALAIELDDSPGLDDELWEALTEPLGAVPSRP